MSFQPGGTVFRGRVWNLSPGIKAAFWPAVEKAIHGPLDQRQPTKSTAGNAPVEGLAGASWIDNLRIRRRITLSTAR
jgi:hypothetical protein